MSAEKAMIDGKGSKLQQKSIRLERPLMVDFFAKVFLGGRAKILKSADAFYVRRREGSSRFSRSQTSGVAIKGDAMECGRPSSRSRGSAG
jgi:hypothetical protein